MDILQAAKTLRPEASWNLRGDTLEQANDGTPRIDPPTMEEIQKLVDADDYKAKRSAAYPPVADQLDALWKGGVEADVMKAQIEAIKAEFPKSK